jgi:NAD(P)-dependent dehydrogenase (short-subunit alcohol dehydrogenase family)
MFMSKVWLITGSGNGLGRDIAEAALAAGNSVVAGARRTEELAPLVAQSASFHSVRKSWTSGIAFCRARLRRSGWSLTWLAAPCGHEAFRAR